MRDGVLVWSERKPTAIAVSRKDKSLGDTVYSNLSFFVFQLINNLEVF